MVDIDGDARTGRCRRAVRPPLAYMLSGAQRIFAAYARYEGEAAIMA